MALAEQFERNFYGDLVCWCDVLDFERIALTTPDPEMVVTAVWVRCVSCGAESHSTPDLDFGNRGEPPLAHVT